MKKILMLSLFNLLFPISVSAAEVPDPYIVTQTIHEEVVPREECVIIVNNQYQYGEEKPIEIDDLYILADEISSELYRVQEEYDALNQYIAQLEAGESDSLDWANMQLTHVIEEVYHHYWHNDSTFSQLNEDEQLGLISQDENVLEWQQYMAEIQQVVNQSLADRGELETYYLSLTYDYEAVLEQIERAASGRDVLNQCQLYPYTSQYISEDQILLNRQTNLTDYLIQIDDYLAQMVPTAYRKVAFEDIYRLFSRMFNTEEVESSGDKMTIILDSHALEEYSYAKELTLKDIETLALNAQLALSNDFNLEHYQSAYEEIISLKEAQWGYIYWTNEQAFYKLQQSLADYLNENQAVSDEAIQHVSSLHQRYQTKLVLYDDLNGVWFPAAEGESGYYYEYAAMSVNNEELMEETLLAAYSTSEETISEMSEDSKLSSEINEESFDETVDQDHLDYLKEHLSQTRTETNIKDLPKPGAKKENSPNKDSDKRKNIELPDTGEKRPLTAAALLILSFGIALVSFNLLARYKTKRKMNDIELD